MLRDTTRTIDRNSLNSFSQQEDRAKGGPKNRIHIKAYCNSDRSAWDNFVLNNGNSSFFHLIGWKEVVEQSFGHRAHYMMAFEEERITGILPLFEIKSRLFGHALVSVPFGVHGGIDSISPSAEEALLRSATVLGRLMGVDYVEMRNQLNGLNRHNRQNWVTKDLYAIFQREIASDIESNFKAIPRKQRRMIRQGIKAGLVSKISRKEYLKNFYSIYARNVRDLGTPVFPLKYFENIMEIFPESFILSVWKDNIMVGGVMTFTFKGRLMPYYGGALRRYFRYAVNDFMYWELMRYGCEKGYKIFDFGRSKKGTGSYDFKRHWGFEPEDLPYLYYLISVKEMPNISPANPRYTTIINIWKRLPLLVANWLGPKIVRNIP